MLKLLRPHIFFADQTTHLKAAARDFAGVHVPYVVANEAHTSATSPAATDR